MAKLVQDLKSIPIWQFINGCTIGRAVEPVEQRMRVAQTLRLCVPVKAYAIHRRAAALNDTDSPPSSWIRVH